MSSAYERFVASMPMDRERWRDGAGYDLSVLRDAPKEDRAAIESLLLSRPTTDWRDVEALAALATPRAMERLRAVVADGALVMALAVRRHAPELVDAETAATLIIRGLAEHASPEALSRAADLAEEVHPPAVVEALLRRLETCDGPTAYDLGTLLLVVHGVLPSRWDLEAAMGERGLLLALTDREPAARSAAIDAVMRRCVSSQRRA